MNKKQWSGLIILVILILSTAYIYAAASESALNTYKQPFYELMTKLETVIVNVKQQHDHQLQYEVIKIKEQKEDELNLYASQEFERIIKEIKGYHANLKEEIEAMDGNQGVKQLSNYESVKQEVIIEDINAEITDYLSEVLSNR